MKLFSVQYIGNTLTSLTTGFDPVLFYGLNNAYNTPTHLVFENAIVLLF